MKWLTFIKSTSMSFGSTPIKCNPNAGGLICPLRSPVQPLFMALNVGFSGGLGLFTVLYTVKTTVSGKFSCFLHHESCGISKFFLLAIVKAKSKKF